MSEALPGEHYCLAHQGNHSHYDPINCTVCKLKARLAAMTSDEVVERATAAFISHNILSKAGIEECIKAALKSASETPK